MAIAYTPAPPSAARADRRRASVPPLTLSELADCLEHIGARTLQLEGSFANIESKIAAVGKNTEQHGIEIFSQTITAIQDQISRMDVVLKEKADNEQLKQIYQSVMSNQMHVHAAQQGREHIWELEQAINTVNKSMKTAEQTLSEKADAVEINDMKAMLATLESNMAILNNSMKEKADIVQVQQSTRSAGDMKELTDTLDLVKSTLNDCARMHDLQELTNSVLKNTAQMCDLEADLKKKAEAMDTRSTSQALSYIEESLEEGRKRIFQLEQAMSSMGKEVKGFERALHMKASSAEVDDLRRLKASLVEMDDLKTVTADGQKRIANFDDILDECVGIIADGQKRITSLEGILHECVSMREIMEVKDAIHSCRLQIVRIQEDTHERIVRIHEDTHERTASSNDKKLRHDMTEIQDLVKNMEQAFRSHAGQYHQLEKKVAWIDSSIEGLQQSKTKQDQAMTEPGEMHREHALEKAIRRLEIQLESRDSAANFAKKIEKVEQSLLSGSDRLYELENAIAKVEYKLGAADALGPRQVASKIPSADALFDFGTKDSGVEGLSCRIQSLDAKLLDVERELLQKVSLEHMKQMQESIRSVQSSMEQTPSGDAASISSLKMQVKDLQQALSDKTTPAGDFRQLRSAVSALQAQMAGLGQFAQQDNVSMDSVQQLKACALSIQAQMNTLQQDLHEKAGADQMQKLKLVLTRLETHVAGIEQGLQEKVGTDQAHQLNNIIAGINSKINCMEQHKADVSNLQQLNDTVMTWQTRVPTTERVQQLEATVTSLGRHLTQVEQSKTGKLKQDAESGGFANIHTQVELQHFKGIIAGMEKKVTDVEQDLQDKVSNGQIQQVRKLITGIDTKIVGVEQLISEKAGVLQVQQLQGVLQAQLTTMEQAVHEKLSADQLHPLKGTIANVQAQVANVEQTLHDKVCISQMQQLKGTIARTESKVSNLDQVVQEKAEATSGHVQKLKDAVASVQTKVAGIDQAVASRMQPICDTAQEPRAIERPDALAARIKRLRVTVPT